jgi:hypothetical protein
VLIRLGYEMVFNVPAPTPTLLMLYVHPSRAATLLEPDRLRVDPAVPVDEFTDDFGNRCARIVAPAGRLRLSNETSVVDSGEPDTQHLERFTVVTEELKG